MGRRLRNLTIVLSILLILLPALGVHADDLQLPDKTNAFYVYDGAEIIAPDVERYIINNNEYLYRQTGAQIVVATINSLEGISKEEYATKLFAKWEIGSKKYDNGVLLLVALEDREIKIETGYGIEGALPDGKAGEIIRTEIIPYFEKGDYSQGIKMGFGSILAIVGEEYQLNEASEVPSQNQQTDTTEGNGVLGTLQKILLAIGLVIFLFIDFTFFGGALTFTLIRIAARGGFRGGGGDNNRGGGGSSGGGGAGGSW